MLGFFSKKLLKIMKEFVSLGKKMLKNQETAYIFSKNLKKLYKICVFLKKS
jgi:hypothetical protein